ncbi:class I SAM-dependent methyltransferase [Acuticoccus mangrovi]|uniref:Class I SAM-dependent methyltransferase n=1 Tax=Acuticoccus mangrovi TaxID=2796142 RepID=A0A934IP52_9HYPH|nr:class I SAM-dependent methyltransferase [Acuticoccus mangrovi]MBJ3776165.1 class I SAM-dependent methyltransferase [Acuticoccus mangrovi]
MSFSADWLSLRAPADARARSLELIDRAGRIARGTVGDRLRIVDLGAGTGATLRALASRLPGPQDWLLVDADASLLAHGKAPPGDITVSTRVADLTATPAPWEGRADLVTASALFDLASRDYIAALADRLAADRTPLLAMLTYDGRLELTPAHPFDAAMREAFNAHQQGEKSFGRAVGPDGPAVIVEVFAAAGFAVERRDTPWVLGEADAALIAATLDGWAAAAHEIRPDAADAIADWRAARAEGVSRLLVGHEDVLALPLNS